MTEEQLKALQAMRVPFAAHHISYLPKGGIKLAYVGHAALTDRLLDVDPEWTWEPLAMSANGLPVMDELGGMWIKLTVCGVTRLGYGHAGSKVGGDAIKEVIGDALRNAAMRFGAALDLWHKGDLHAEEKPVKIVHTPTQGAMDSLPDDQRLYLQELAMEVIASVAAGTPRVGYERVQAEKLDDTQETALWSILDSKTRAAMKAAKNIPL